MLEKIQNVKYSVIQRTQFKYTSLEHPDWTLYVVIDVSFRCELNGKEDLIQAWDLYFIPPNEPFRRSVVDHLKVHFFRFDLAENAAEDDIPRGKVVLRDDARLKSSLRMLKHVNAFEAGEENAFLFHILSDILLQCRYERTVPENKTCSDPLVLDVIGYFKEYYAKKIHMRQVAEQFGISPSGLILKFRRATGMLPSEHLIAIRIKQAKQLLVDTSYPLSRIAEQTGFENCYYFSNAFKREVGVSPSEYRRRYSI